MKNKTIKTLIDAINSGNEKIVREMLETHSINEPNKYGQVPLMEIIKRPSTKKNENMFNLFISMGANVNAQDIDGYTPLSYALSFSKVKYAETLMACGADLDVDCVVHIAAHPRAYLSYEKTFGRTAYPESKYHRISVLCGAIYKSLDRLAIELIDQGANLDRLGGLDITALSIAVRSSNLDIVSYLLKKGANPNILPKNWEEYSSNEEEVCPVALKKALKYGYGSAIDLLLKHNSQIPQLFPRKNNVYSTPLTYMFSQPKNQLMEVFHSLQILKERVGVAQLDSNSRSALSYAIEHGHSGYILKHLMDEEINNKEDKNGYTPMYYAWIHKNYEAMALLYDAGVPMANGKLKGSGKNLLMLSVILRDFEMVEFMLKYSPNLLEKDNNGNTILDYVEENMPCANKIKELYALQNEKIKKARIKGKI